MYYVSPESNLYLKQDEYVTLDAALMCAERLSTFTKPGTHDLRESFQVWECHPKTHDRVVRAVATDGRARWMMACPTCDGRPATDEYKHWKCDGKGYIEDPRGSR